MSLVHNTFAFHYADGTTHVFFSPINLVDKLAALVPPFSTLKGIKPFVIGRKAWLFSQTANGAYASAILYSIIETAKANEVKVFEYIMHSLDVLSHKEPEIDQLLPWQFAKS